MPFTSCKYPRQAGGGKGELVGRRGRRQRSLVMVVVGGGCNSQSHTKVKLRISCKGLAEGMWLHFQSTYSGFKQIIGIVLKYYVVNNEEKNLHGRGL